MYCCNAQLIISSWELRNINSKLLYYYYDTSLLEDRVNWSDANYYWLTERVTMKTFKILSNFIERTLFCNRLKMSLSSILRLR